MIKRKTILHTRKFDIERVFAGNDPVETVIDRLSELSRECSVTQEVEVNLKCHTSDMYGDEHELEFSWSEPESDEAFEKRKASLEATNKKRAESEKKKREARAAKEYETYLALKQKFELGRT